MNKTVLSIDDLMVESFTTANPAELNDEWTGCMSECGAPGCA